MFRCISDVSVGRKVISASYSSAIFSSLSIFHFLIFILKIYLFIFGRIGSSLLCAGYL